MKYPVESAIADFIAMQEGKVVVAAAFDDQQ